MRWYGFIQYAFMISSLLCTGIVLSLGVYAMLPNGEDNDILVGATLILLGFINLLGSILLIQRRRAQ